MKVGTEKYIVPNNTDKQSINFQRDIFNILIKEQKELCLIN